MRTRGPLTVLLYLLLGASSARATPAALDGARCRQGDASACITQGERAGRAGDFATSIAAYRRACRLGAARGCVALANAYAAEGRRDEATAAWMAGRIAAARQCRRDAASPSCILLADLLLDGTTDRATSSPGQAAAVLRAACDAGSGEGCYQLGSLYEVGQGLREDDARAEVYFDRACSLGWCSDDQGGD